MKTPSKKADVFQNYANFYDTFYEEKNYKKEADYVLALVRKHLGRMPRTILDLGCGTGGHALLWSKSGIAVTGLDRSDIMLEQAQKKAQQNHLKIKFIQGDVRKFELRRKFDTAVAMFAVMSYQTTRNDILSTLRCVRRHLRRGGIFIFDAWFGPGVLTDPPGDRVKSFTKNELEILRTVKSVHHLDNQSVDVHYDILVIHRDHILQRIREVHSMHYYFPLEVQSLAESTGFCLINSHPFLYPKNTLHENDWNATFVLKAT
jgi:ubiquinone/menaquinone biosynthesis C-methylase UbiE